MNFKEYLSKEDDSVNEAKNTFRMGKYIRSEDFDIGAKSIKGKISLNIFANINNPRKAIYDDGESVYFELEYDREDLEKQIKDQIMKMVSKSAKQVTDITSSGGNLLSFPSNMTADEK